MQTESEAGEGHALNSARLDARVPNGCAAGAENRSGGLG